MNVWQKILSGISWLLTAVGGLAIAQPQLVAALPPAAQTAVQIAAMAGPAVATYLHHPAAVAARVASVAPKPVG